MSEHPVDIDEHAVGAAREKLGTDTTKDTVNRALLQAGGDQGVGVKEHLDGLARAEVARREQALRSRLPLRVRT